MADDDGTATAMEMEEGLPPPPTPAPASAPPPPPPRHRSAVDYVDEPSLRAALRSSPMICAAPPRMPSKEDVSKGLCAFTNLTKLSPATCCDWQSPKLDLETSRPHTMEDEVKRLMELKEYAILDTEHEEKFERITALASRIFEVPICLVSLVDIGRQWFKSNRGLGEVRETSRELSFCAHAIVSQQDVFIVPDTLLDPRFVTNGLVTGPPHIRFYAGVPLVTPRGHKLGTFCIIDQVPRPEGLTLGDKQNLRELTEMVVDTMVHRKKEMERLVDEKTRLIACAAHDLLSPLTGIRLNLGLLMEDEGLERKMDREQRELMETSLECSDMIERICVKAIESFRGDLTRVSDSGAAGEAGVTGSEGVENGGTSRAAEEKEEGLVNVDRLVAGVERVIGTFPKRVPFFVEKAKNMPKTIVADDLKLFRSILNYLTNACKHTHAGSIKLRIYVRKAANVATTGGTAMGVVSKGDNSGEDGRSAMDMELDLLPGALVAPKRDMFVVEVHDTGPGIGLEKYPALFTPLGMTDSAADGDGGGKSQTTPPTPSRGNQHSRMANSGLGLYSVATEIGSLGGEYGVFPRQDLVASHPDNHHHESDGNCAATEASPETPGVTGCVFWFSVPLTLPPGKAERKEETASTLKPSHSSSTLVSGREDLGVIKQNANCDHSVNVVTVTRAAPVTSSIDDDAKLMPSPKAVPTSEAMKRSFGTANKSIMAAAAIAANTDNDGNGLAIPSPRQQPRAKRPKRAKRVLIIDDSVTIRKGLARGFERLGFEVDQAENGLQGYKQMKKECYEVVLLDFLMPVMDGPDVARKFRDWEAQYRPNFHQYIVGISAHANGKDAELGLKAGMDRFMGKPVPLKSLTDLAESKPVTEASLFLEARFQRSNDAIDAACKGRGAEDQQQQHEAEDSSNSLCSTSSLSSAASTFSKQSCLIVTKKETDSSSPSSQHYRAGHFLQRLAEKNGWRTVVKHGGGEDALRLLKLRKWDAAFIDDDLPVLSGTSCLVRFRDWERRTRAGAVRQRNIYVISDYEHSVCHGGDESDGVLTKPVDPSKVLQILDDASEKCKLNREVLLR